MQYREWGMEETILRKVAREMGAPLAYLGAVILAWFPAWAPGAGFTSWDWTDTVYPFYSISRDGFAASGALPFWNPYLYCGMPHMAAIANWALYPTELVAVALGLPGTLFYKLDILLHAWMAATGLYLFLRLEGRGRWGAFAGGLAYVAGGSFFTLASAGHMNWLRGLAWLPIILCAVRRAGVTGSFRLWALGGVCYAMPLLGSSMQFTVYVAPVLVFLVAAEGRPGLGKRMAGLALLFAVAAGIGAVAWVPATEYYLHSIRSDPTYGGWFATQWKLEWGDLVCFLAPNIYGVTGAGGYAGPHSFRSTNDYPGLLVLALAATGLFAGGTRGRRQWGILAAASVVLAMDIGIPGVGSLTSLPLMSNFRGGMRWLVFLHLALAVLAARGWEVLASREGRPRYAPAAALGAVSLAAFIVSVAPGGVGRAVCATEFGRWHTERHEVTEYGVAERAGSELSSVGVRAAGGALAAAALVSPAVPAAGAAVFALADAALDVFNANKPFLWLKSSTAVRPDPVADQVAAMEGTGPRESFRVASDEYLMTPNWRIERGIESVYGYHPLPLARYLHLYHVVERDMECAGTGILNAKYTVLAGPRPQVKRNAMALPRAFLGAALAPCSSPKEAWLRTGTTGCSPRTVPTDSAVSVGSAGRAFDTRGKVSLERSQDRFRIGVDSRGPSLLVVAEGWYPAWKAFVDGKRERIIRAYGAFMALELPPGRHGIELSYDSWTFKAGLLLACFSAVAVALAALPGRRREVAE